MSKDINELYQEDPNAGNDPSDQTIKFVVEKSGISKALTIEQLSQLVSYQLGLSENPSAPSAFSARTQGDDVTVIIIEPEVLPEKP